MVISPLSNARCRLGMTGVNYFITADTTALTAADGAGWELASSNKVKFTFDGLVSGQRLRESRAGGRTEPGSI
jgi:hypothetical protein